MSLSSLFLAVWLLLVGGTWADVYPISGKFLGLWAIITGIIWLIEGVHPITVWKRP